MEPSMPALITAAGALVVSALIGVWAKRLGILDVPNERSSHVAPTARGGGIGIVIATVAGVALASPSQRLVPLLIIGTSIAIVGLIDDVKDLSPAVRLPLQTAAATALTIAYGSVNTVEFFRTWRIAAIVAVPATIVWIVAVTNAYNFMDGIDGIAGAQTIVAASVWFVIEQRRGDAVLAVLALCLGASALGFLLHNWPPASLFMGDVGSAFLGMTFAALAILDRRPTAPAVAFIVIFPFLFDTAYTLLRRARRGERVWKAHRSHLYQRLVIAGWSHRAATLLYLAVAAIDGAAALLVDERAPNAGVIAIVVMIASAATLIAITFAAERRALRAAP
jgi:UDP-N-acetylmuramyl pentapeptide phosphotransferase/UDP-N-acetylglucosamine-1-phosphate transferase